MAVIGGNLALGIQWRHFTTSWDSNVDVTSTTSFFNLATLFFCYKEMKQCYIFLILYEMMIIVYFSFQRVNKNKKNAQR